MIHVLMSVMGSWGHVTSMVIVTAFWKKRLIPTFHDDQDSKSRVAATELYTLASSNASG